VCGSLGEGRKVVAVGRPSMDLSRWGQSRDAEGRHPAARPGLGPWVGARVASPRGPILRPGSSSVLGATTTWQSRGRSAARRGGSSARCGVRCFVLFFSASIRIFKIRRIIRDGIAVIRGHRSVLPPFSRVAFAPFRERPAKYRGARTEVIGPISDTANSAVVLWARYARGDRLELPDRLCPRSALRATRSSRRERP
jgi:hypothetical protein